MVDAQRINDDVLTVCGQNEVIAHRSSTLI